MTAEVPLPEPSPTVTDPAARFVDYLDYFRSEVRRTVSHLDADALVTVVVPSGWTIPGLVEHLVHMERRWLVWGFLGEDVPDPEGDRDDDETWVSHRPVGEALDALDEGGRRTREIVATHALDQRAATGGKWPVGTETPTLLSILFHVEQEYARHAGHLDIVREVIDGRAGRG